MRSFCALGWSLLVWNALSPLGWTAVDRQSEVSEPATLVHRRVQALVEESSVRYEVHGYIDGIYGCAPGAMPGWQVRAQGQYFHLELVNADLEKKVAELPNKPVLVSGWFRKGVLVVERLEEDKRDKREEAVTIHLTGRLKDFDMKAGTASMEIDGKLYRLKLSEALIKKGSHPKDGVVVASGEQQMSSEGVIVLVQTLRNQWMR